MKELDFLEETSNTVRVAAPVCPHSAPVPGQQAGAFAYPEAVTP